MLNDLPRHMDTVKAQHTACVKLPALLQLDEIKALEAAILAARVDGMYFGDELLQRDASALSMLCRCCSRGGWRWSCCALGRVVLARTPVVGSPVGRAASCTALLDCALLSGDFMQTSGVACKDKY